MIQVCLLPSGAPKITEVTVTKKKKKRKTTKKPNNPHLSELQNRKACPDPTRLVLVPD